MKLCTLDEYLKEKAITSNEISHIWIDTEGYEANALHGAMDTLNSKRIPIWQEFNPHIYRRQGTWERYLEDMGSVYKRFVDFREVREAVKREHDIRELRTYPEVMGEKDIHQTDLFFY